MFLGTSTGSLIAFGLVGGKKNDNGMRIPMSVQEITDLYEKEIPKLFQTRMSWGDWVYSWISPSSWKESIWNNFKRLSLSPPTETNGWSYSLFGRKTQNPVLGVPATPYTRTSFRIGTYYGWTVNDVLCL